MTKTTVIRQASAIALPTEGDVLERFWATWADLEGRFDDRLTLLMHVSLLQIATATDWNPTAIRDAFAARPFMPTGCTLCRRRDRRLHWHHIVAIAHGGTNRVRNQMQICHVCHRRIHPWLDEEPDTGGWVAPDHLIKRLAAGQIGPQPKRDQVLDDDWHPHHGPQHPPDEDI